MILSDHSQMTGGVYGARSPKRQPLSQPLSEQPRITRPVTALLPAVAPAVAQGDPAATMPALPVLPTSVVPVLQPQSAAWRQHALELAWKTDWQSQASLERHYDGGVDWFSVPSGSHGHRTYRVIFTPHAGAVTVHDGDYICHCIQGMRGNPCRHAGAALELAQLRAEVRESMALAQADHRSWAWATHDGWSDQGRLAWFRLHDYTARGIGRVRVGWDTERDVAIWCDCGQTRCLHIGAVALRVAKEKRDHLRRMQAGYGPDWNDDLLWDGSTLPAPLV